MNSDCHYMVVISVGKCSDCHYILSQISLPRSDSHYSFFYSACIHSHRYQIVHAHVLLEYYVTMQLPNKNPFVCTTTLYVASYERDHCSIYSLLYGAMYGTIQLSSPLCLCLYIRWYIYAHYYNHRTVSCYTILQSLCIELYEFNRNHLVHYALVKILVSMSSVVVLGKLLVSVSTEHAKINTLQIDSFSNPFYHNVTSYEKGNFYS